MTMDDELTQAIFDLGPFVRYVAYGEGHKIGTREADAPAVAGDVARRLERFDLSAG
jgi:hypothetical protein